MKTALEFFLPRRADWMRRAILGAGYPVRPTTGDLGPVQDALADVVDAAGGLEHSRAQLARVMATAQVEFDDLMKGPPGFWEGEHWSGANTAAVYLEFCNAVAWTRAVDDRFLYDRLRPAVQHDSALWKELQQIRSTTAGAQFEDARLLAKVILHKFTLPYPGAASKVEDGVLVYPVPKILNANDYQGNPLVPGRHVASVVDDLWAAVERFVDQLLDVFYPQPGGTKQ